MSENPLSHIAVLGAFGKMGSGISLIVLAAMAENELSLTGKIGNYRLHLVDANDAVYTEVLIKIRKHLRDFAEKNIQSIRKSFAARKDLIENHEMVDEFINGAIACIRVTSDCNTIKKCHLVFEAVSENMDLKIKLFTTIKNNCENTPMFLTNTSSIPIAELASKTDLVGQIIGYHFYNPPQKQKLVELVVPTNTNQVLKETAELLTKCLRKTTVPSNDVAGFIGNGHFMREILQADKMVGSNYERIPVLDGITRDFLIRPMGIFQLIDYVGLDVCQSILKVMSKYLNKKLSSPLINLYMAEGIKGGQNPDGSQKNGFFQYEKYKISGYYSISKKGYDVLPLTDYKKSATSIFQNYASWKTVIAHTPEAKNSYFSEYFKTLFSSQNKDAQEACLYLKSSRKIAEDLIADRVAANIEDVNKVLTLGFQHAYGPGNKYY
jgi:3-hydroxyacyl-CoA dehydrogenase